jgi:hypothetical protein
MARDGFKAYIYQTGNFNEATQTQTHTNLYPGTTWNEATITQNGNRNNGSIIQSGDIATATIEQTGNLNIGSIVQTGVTSTGTITQLGTGNTGTIYQ